MFLSFLGARINEGHFGIETIYFLWIELNPIRYGGNTSYKICVLSRNHVVPGITYQVRIINVFPIGITEDLTQHPADNHDCRRERQRAWSRARRRKPRFCFGGAG